MTWLACKDIPDRPILEFLRDWAGRGGYLAAGWHDLHPRNEYVATVRDAMPPDLPDKLVLAKMATLVRRGLVSGCVCGCRGDFGITARGLDYLRDQAR